VPQWGPFLAVVALLTVLLLALARQSQQFIHQHAGREESDGDSDRPENAPDGSGDSAGIPGEFEDAGGDTHGPETPVDTDDASGDPGERGAVVDPEDRSASSPDHRSGPAEEGETPAGTGTGKSSQSPEEESAMRGSPEIELTSRLLLANVASTQALFAGVVLAAAWFFSIPADAFGVTGEPLASGPPGVAVGLAFGVGLWLANELSTTVADAVGAAYDETVRELLAPESTRGWVGVFLVVLPLIAIAEELLFRAALIGVPAAGFGVSPWLLAVVASLAFALGHGAQGRVGIVVTGLLGLALAAGYILTGSLLVVVVAHYLINALEFLLHEFVGVDPLPFAVRADPRSRSGPD
jgi:membrane protease YdiL (CAAX protease family)